MDKAPNNPFRIPVLDLASTGIRNKSTTCTGSRILLTITVSIVLQYAERDAANQNVSPLLLLPGSTVKIYSNIHVLSIVLALA